MAHRIALLHFASWPVVGGVEATLTQHALALTNQGYAVQIITGLGTPFDDRIPVIENALFGSRQADMLAVKKQLDQGRIPPEFVGLVQAQVAALKEALRGCDVCIAHNVHTLHKNLALTAALAEVTQNTTLQMLAWCHDVAWDNTQYQSELYAGYPWDLLRTKWQHTHYVTLSQDRQQTLARLLGCSPNEITVIGGGIDPSPFWSLTPRIQALAERLQLWQADLILLLPARITRRKNLPFALLTLAELRHLSGVDCRLVVTGPPGPHNAENSSYLQQMLVLRKSLKLEDAAHFLYLCGEQPHDGLHLDDASLAQLYRMADALLFPSLQEGFGLPILEAALARLPIFCSDLPPFRQTAGDLPYYFNPQTQTPNEVANQIWATLQQDTRHQLRRHILQNYRWEMLLDRHLMPILEGYHG